MDQTGAFVLLSLTTTNTKLFVPRIDFKKKIFFFINFDEGPDHGRPHLSSNEREPPIQGG